MKVFVFKTDIKSKQKAKAVSPIFNHVPAIADWSVDTEDVDHVLRIEAKGDIAENEIIRMVRTGGFVCEVLTD